MSQQPTVLVTRATGHVGGHLVRQLEGHLTVRALARDPASASVRPGEHIDVVGGDLGRPDSLTGALGGVGLGVPRLPVRGSRRRSTGAHHHHHRRARAADRGPVRARRSRRAGSARRSGRQHPGLARLPGGPHRRLGPRVCLPARQRVRCQHAGLGRTAPRQRHATLDLSAVPPRAGARGGLAAVAARALSEDGQLRLAYHLTGPQQLTQTGQLAAIGTVLGRSLQSRRSTRPTPGRRCFPACPRRSRSRDHPGARGFRRPAGAKSPTPSGS